MRFLGLRKGEIASGIEPFQVPTSMGDESLFGVLADMYAGTEKGFCGLGKAERGWGWEVRGIGRMNLQLRQKVIAGVYLVRRLPAYVHFCLRSANDCSCMPSAINSRLLLIVM